MKLKSMLLGTAASLVMTSGAFAADAMGETVVPVAVDYVKVCDAAGAGFFTIPGGETCLKIGGRIRAWAFYDEDADDDDAGFRVDARVDFETYSMSDLGEVRSFLRLESGGNDTYGRRGSLQARDDLVAITQAYIQVGYLTVGYTADGDFLYDDDAMMGINDVGFGPLAAGVFAQVRADDLGGGMFAGIQAVVGDGEDRLLRPTSEDAYAIQGIVGIADQAWGDANLSAAWGDSNDGADVQAFTVKATGNFTITEQLSARATVGYLDFDGDDAVGVGGGLSFAATDAITVYTSGLYLFVDGDDAFGANAGLSYGIGTGLTLDAEVAYFDDGGDDDGDLWVGTRLVREW
jgi:Porin subfamily.